jgi:hypothetical protein
MSITIAGAKLSISSLHLSLSQPALGGDRIPSTKVKCFGFAETWRSHKWNLDLGKFTVASQYSYFRQLVPHPNSSDLTFILQKLPAQDR